MINKTDEKQTKLNNLLWSAADAARSHVDASVFKDYILVLLFLKYLSDLSKKEASVLKERYGADKAALERRLKAGRFYLPKGSSFDELYEKRTQDDFGVLINQALHKIEDENKSKLENIFQSVDFNSEAVLGKKNKRNPMLIGLFEVFKSVDLDVSDQDVVGNAYMYLIERFGSDAGKKAGEFFTPAVVSGLLAKLGGAKDGYKILDPACGSGGLLLLAGHEVASGNYALFGQESVGTTYNMARMNMFLHGKDSAEIEWGDSLRDPAFVEKDHLKQFDLVLANPPFSLDKWGFDDLQNDTYNRFTRGMPPKSKGDYAFISHMIASAKDFTGRVAVIVPHGVLFRGSSEGRIRKALIEENLLDAVIGLPKGLFQTTDIPVAILIFDKSRQEGGENQDRKNIVFIDASNEFISGKKQNTLSDEHIEKILTTYQERKEIEKYSHIATPEEIQENDYNLNIPRYVDTFEEEAEIDLQAVKSEIQKIETELATVQNQMDAYLKELGL